MLNLHDCISWSLTPGFTGQAQAVCRSIHPYDGNDPYYRSIDRWNATDVKQSKRGSLALSASGASHHFHTH